MAKTRVYQLPCVVAEDSRLPPGAKMLYAVLSTECHGSTFCSISTGTLAKRLGATRGTNYHKQQKLQGLGLIKIKRCPGTYNRYYVKDDKADKSIPLPADVLERHELSYIVRLVFCYILHSRAANNWCWLRAREIAEVLGLSINTVQRAIRELTARGMIRAKSGGAGCKKGKKYRVTSAEGLPGVSPGHRDIGVRPGPRQRAPAVPGDIR